MAETDQTVVTGTDGGAKPGTEATDARKPDDLDTLLAEFERTATPPATKPEPVETAPASPDVTKRLESLEKALTDRQVQDDLAPVIKSIKEAIPEGVLKDREIYNLLDGMAQDDPRLARAWRERHTNPDQWAKVSKAIVRDFDQRFKKLPDKAATEDREAVAAAVRGASTSTPPPAAAPDYSRMGNGEFAKDVQDKYGFRPF